MNPERRINQPIGDMRLLNTANKFSLVSAINEVRATALSGGSVWGGITGTLSNQTDLQTVLNTYQPVLVSGTNIRTINGNTLLGSTDLVIAAGGGTWGSITGTLSSQSDLSTALNSKSPLAGSSSLTTLGTISAGSIPYSLITSVPGFLLASTAATTYSPIAGSSSLTTLGTIASGAVPYSLLTGAPFVPTIISNGLVSYFNFGDSTKTTVVSGTITQIVDSIGGVVSSQATTAQQPIYFTNGGINNAPYANFTGTQTLAGALLTASTAYTLFIIRRVAAGISSNAQIGSFQNGNTTSSGYGWVDYQTGTSGFFYPGVTSGQGAEFYNAPNRWEVVVASHSAGVNKLYNSIGQAYVPISTTANPATPTGGHIIGNLNFGGIAKFQGDIAGIYLYNRQLTDIEVLTNLQVMNAGIATAPQLNAGGDSKMAGLGGLPNVGENLATSIIAANSYMYLNTTAVSGRTTDITIAAFPTEVIGKYQKGVPNVYVYMEGHNDLANGKSATYVQTNLKLMCSMARAAGYKVIAITDLYTGTNVSGFAATNTNKDLINTDMRANPSSYGDILVDANALTHATAANMAIGTWSSDGIHPMPILSAEISTLANAATSNLLTGNTTYGGPSTWITTGLLTTSSTAFTPLLNLTNITASTASTDLFSPSIRFRTQFFNASTDKTSDFFITAESNSSSTVSQLLISYSLAGAASSNILSIDRFGNFNVQPTGASFKMTNGNFQLGTAGNKFLIATGTNASIGVATLVAGTVTIATTAVTANSLIYVVYNTPAGTLASGLSAPDAGRTAGTSFVINSLTTAGIVNTLDTSTVRWWIIN